MIEDILGSLKRTIDELPGESLGLWFSGGGDSLLLLKVLIGSGRSFGVLRFDDGWDLEQKRQTAALILEHNVQVFSYAPRTAFLIGSADGSEISLATGYSIDADGRVAMLVRDLTDQSGRCAFDVKIELAGGIGAPIPIDTHIWGTRSDDRHWSLENAELARRRWKIGSSDFEAPLWDWTREQVDAALKIYGHTRPPIDTGDIRCCSDCLRALPGTTVYCPKEAKDIPAREWDRGKNLELLKELTR